MERATEHAERTLARHNPESGWHLVTAASHPNLFEAFEAISHDAGYGAGHTNYSVPSEVYTPEQLETFETQLGMMTKEQQEDFVIGGDEKELNQTLPELDEFLDHFFCDWEYEV